MRGWLRAAVVAVAAVTVAPAGDPCQGLTPVGVGSLAPKYPSVGAEGSCTAGEYTLNAWGHDYYWGWDRGGFAYYTVAGSDDFTFSARIKQAERLFCTAEKVGLCVREGLAGNERAVQVRWDGFHDELYWFYRFAPGTAASEFCSEEARYACFREGATGTKVLNTTTLKVARTSGRYALYVDDVRVASTEKLILASDPVYVGLIFSCGGGMSPVSETVRFDAVQCTGVCPKNTGALTVFDLGRRARPWQMHRAGTALTVHAPTAGAARSILSLNLLDATGRVVGRMDPVSSAGNQTTFQMPAGIIAAGVLVGFLRLSDGRDIAVRTAAAR